MAVAGRRSATARNSRSWLAVVWSTVDTRRYITARFMGSPYAINCLYLSACSTIAALLIRPVIFHRNNPCQLADAERNAPGLAARVTRFGHEAKSKTSIGRPFYPYHAAPLGTLDGNIQDPIAGWPTGKRAKVRHCPCGHGYTVFNLNRRFPWAAA
jgi:hypothetical protein